MSQNVLIRLASQRVNSIVTNDDNPPQLFTPGEKITQDSGYLRYECDSKHIFHFIYQ